MKKAYYLKYWVLFLSGMAILSMAGVVFAGTVSSDNEISSPATFLLMIKEQNIEGPQQAWWASEIDLSTVEARIAQVLNSYNYKVVDPSQLKRLIESRPAFRTIDINEEDSLELAKLENIDYVVLGKAVASAGGTILNSKMRSCFANVTVKLIRVRDGKIVAYLDATASSPHIDVVTGGMQALAKAGTELAEKIVKVLEQEGGVVHGRSK